MAKLSGYDRFKILKKAAELMIERQEDLGRTISLEEGKAIAEGRLEANRAVETMMGSAEEAKRIHGRPSRSTARRAAAGRSPSPSGCRAASSWPSPRSTSR
jgi:acyl-CoA reductase-like NAD-dependent aldehyde dehydrogenase